MLQNNFFIVGAAKSGTSSFHDYLGQHPEINMSRIKEPNYFSSRSIKADSLYYNNAPLIESKTEYESLFQKNNWIKGESSVSYLYYPEAAENIKNYDENAKIIILLRNPVERAYSHYLMDYSAGYINNDFSDLIRNKSLNPIAYQQSVEYSYYSKQVKRYYALFPKEQIKVIILEETFAKQTEVLREIEEFIGVKKFIGYNLEVKNSYSSSNNFIINSIYRSIQLKSMLKRFIPKNLIVGMKTLFLKSEKPKLKAKDKSFLHELFADDVKQLSITLNKDLERIWN